MKIFLKICFGLLFFINQSFAQTPTVQTSTQVPTNQEPVAQESVSGTWSQSEKNSEYKATNNNKATAAQTPKANGSLSQPPKIVSSINPIQQIAKFISGDEKNNSLLINPRGSEHDYQFKVSNINSLNNSDVVFYISDGLENNLAKALTTLKKQPKIVQLSKAKNIQLLTFQTRPDEDSTDGHIWLNPENAVAMATEIADTLSSLYPSASTTYKKNLERFIIDVKNMDQKNKIELFKVRPKSFMIDHNSTAYFENYYALPSAGVMRYYHDQELTAKDIERINNVIKKERVVCILGSFQERSGLAVQLAMNNKTKFALIDIMGSEINNNQNGYTKMMSGLVSDLVKCVNNK